MQKSNHLGLVRELIHTAIDLVRLAYWVALLVAVIANYLGRSVEDQELHSKIPAS